MKTKLPDVKNQLDIFDKILSVYLIFRTLVYDHFIFYLRHITWYFIALCGEISFVISYNRAIRTLWSNLHSFFYIKYFEKTDLGLGLLIVKLGFLAPFEEII